MNGDDFETLMDAAAALAFAGTGGALFLIASTTPSAVDTAGATVSGVLCLVVTAALVHKVRRHG